MVNILWLRYLVNNESMITITCYYMLLYDLEKSTGLSMIIWLVVEPTPLKFDGLCQLG